MSFLSKSLNPTEVAAIARFFSASVVQEMAQTGKSALFSRLVLQSSLRNALDQSEPASKLFDLAFSILKKKAYRHEYVYKAAITHKLLLGKHSLRTASMLTEFRIGRCKADVVILNGTSTVYEIKSERDKLDRLETQISEYRKVFAKVNIITGENHLQSVIDTTSPEVGVLLLNDQFRISTIREAVDCTDRIEPEAVFNSMSQSEAIKILEHLNILIPKLPNTQIHQAIRDLFIKIPPRELHESMLHVLKEKRSLLHVSELANSLPDSLKAVVFATTLRKKDYSRLLDAVNTPIKNVLNWA